jgi:hypothetical protein
VRTFKGEVYAKKFHVLLTRGKDVQMLKYEY